jgi:hypothetical protein
LLAFGQDDIINQCHFGDDNFIPPSSGLHRSVIEHSTDDQHDVDAEFTKIISKNNTSWSFQTILELIHGFLFGLLVAQIIQHSFRITSTMGVMTINLTDNPTIAEVAKHLARCNGKLLNEKQHITYDIIAHFCCNY